MKEFNKQIRQKLYPVLREIGFERIGNRKSLLWKGDVIYRLEIKAVGSYFRDVTGWPSGSFSCSINPFYSFLHDNCEKDEMGKLIPPKRWISYGGKILLVSIEQSKYTKRLKNPAERKRTDLWWLEDDESNVNEVVEHLVKQVIKEVPEYLKNELELSYKNSRSFFPPEEKRLQEYLKNASKDGALYQINKMIAFSNYLHKENDNKLYCELLKSIG